MKSKIVHTYYEGPQATERFKAAIKTISLSTRSDMERREEKY
jgi:hypothetical protein